MKEFLRKNIGSEIKQHLPFLLLLSLLCWGVFFTALNNDFVSDDIHHFVKNDQYHDFKNIMNIKEFTATKFTYALSYSLFGINPIPFHALAIFMHNLNCILVFFFVLKVFKKRKVAYISAALFCTHPLVTEPLNWVSARHYLSNTTIILTCAFFYINFRKEEKRKNLWISLVIAALGLLLTRNPWTLTLPFFILIVELFFLDTKIKRRFYPTFYFGIAILFVGIYFFGRIQDRVDFMGSSIPTTPESSPSYINRVTYTTMSAARLLFYPKKLSLYPEGERVSNTFLLGGQLVLIISLILFVTWIVHGKYKKAGVLTSIYISLLPAFSPIQVSWFIAERYLYFAVIFFAIFLSSIIVKLEKTAKLKNLAIYMTLLILGIYIFRDIKRGRDWQNRKSLWEATARTNPNSARVYNNLGDVYALEGNMEKSIENFKKAVEIDPLYAEAMYNLGNTYIQIGENEKGEEIKNKALELNPTMLE